VGVLDHDRLAALEHLPVERVHGPGRIRPVVGRERVPVVADLVGRDDRFERGPVRADEVDAAEPEPENLPRGVHGDVGDPLAR
jgi:hypothetical protein